MKIFQKRLVAAIIMIIAIAIGFTVGSRKRPAGGAAISGEFDYVLHNESGAVSQKTASYIEAMNESLFAQTGAQIVIDVVDTTGSQDIVDYAEDIFIRHGIGSRERDNGILLVLALRNLHNGVPEGDYYIAWGGGFSDRQKDRLGEVLLNNMEFDFAAQRYDSGVRKTFDALIGELEDIYHVTIREHDTGGAIGDYQAHSGGYAIAGSLRPALLLGNLIGLLILLTVVWVILDAFRYRRYRRRCLRTGFPSPPRYYPIFWGRPRAPRRPPPPPRASGAGRPSGGFHSGGSFGGGTGRPSGGFHSGGSFGGGTGRPSGGFRSGGSFGGGAGRSRPSVKAPRSSGGARRPSGGTRRPGGGRRR